MPTPTDTQTCDSFDQVVDVPHFARSFVIGVRAKDEADILIYYIRGPKMKPTFNERKDKAATLIVGRQ
jgi:hypothetical protein